METNPTTPLAGRAPCLTFARTAPSTPPPTTSAAVPPPQGWPRPSTPSWTTSSGGCRTRPTPATRGRAASPPATRPSPSPPGPVWMGPTQLHWSARGGGGDHSRPHSPVSGPGGEPLLPAKHVWSAPTTIPSLIFLVGDPALSAGRGQAPQQSPKRRQEPFSCKPTSILMVSSILRRPVLLATMRPGGGLVKVGHLLRTGRVSAAKWSCPVPSSARGRRR